jgi:hypothetical protein
VDELLKRFWFCEGVDEAWMTAEGDQDWERLVKQYAADGYPVPGGPYVLLSDVEAMLKGWSGYAWKDGQYIDSVQEYFDRALRRE